MTCCNANGWIVEGGMVVDRCAVCNPPPRRPAPTWWQRNRIWAFPVIFLATLVTAELIGLSLFVRHK